MAPLIHIAAVLLLCYGAKMAFFGTAGQQILSAQLKFRSRLFSVVYIHGHCLPLVGAAAGPARAPCR
jgi:hypothetical protein